MDLISRAAAIDAVRSYYDEFDTSDKSIEERIKALPSAQERKKGRWTRQVLGSTAGYGTTVMYQCSNCEQMAMSRYHYCPNCGADMRGGEDE